MSTITRESITDTIEGLEQLTERGIQSVYVDMAIAGMRSLLASLEAEPVAWTDEQELRDVAKDGCGYLFTVKPITPHADPRRVIKLYTAPPAPETADREMLKRLAVILSGSDAPGEIRSLTVTAQSFVERCKILAKERDAYRIDIHQGKADSNSPVVPDSWVIVPVEPTEDMIVKGFESEPDECFSDPVVWEAYDAMSGCQQAAHRAKLCWAAMIAAAPKSNSTTSSKE